MYGFREDISIIRLLHGSINVPGAVESFICDLHCLPGDFITALHLLDDFSDIRLFGFISGIHLHGNRNQIRIQEEGLPDDGIMPVLFGGPFLLITTGQIDLEIVIRTVKEYIVEVPLIVLLITIRRTPDLLRLESWRRDGGRQQRLSWI